MQKGFAPILILVGILILVAVAGGAYFLGKQTAVPQPSPTPAASPAPTGIDETANWKTYTNTKYGFSFKYPTTYTFHDDGPNYVEIAIQKGQQVSGTQPAILDVVTFSSQTDNFSVNVYPESFSSNADFNTNIHNLYEYSGVCGTQFADKTLLNTISQINEIQYKEVKQSSASDVVMVDICFFSPANNLIVLRGKGNKVENLFSQILSTFKFTN